MGRLVQSHPPRLYAAEVPLGSERWYPVDSELVADALRASGYTVRPYVALVDLMEATGEQSYIRAAARQGPHRISEGVAREAVRGFLLRVSREVPGA